MMRMKEESEVETQNSAGRASIELHVEELVLHGFPASDRHRLGDAVEQELLRLLTEHGMVAREDSTAQRVAAAAIRISEPLHGDTVGAQIAASIFNALPGIPDHIASREALS